MAIHFEFGFQSLPCLLKPFIWGGKTKIMYYRNTLLIFFFNERFSHFRENSEKISKPRKMPADFLVVLVRMYRLVDLLCRRSRLGTNQECTAGQTSLINPVTWSQCFRQPIRMKQIRTSLRGERICTNAIEERLQLRW